MTKYLLLGLAVLGALVVVKVAFSSYAILTLALGFSAGYAVAKTR